jgi:hypothetical protein
MCFGAAFLTVAAIILDPRPGPPRAVYFLFVLLFALASARMVTSRYFSTPSLVLERGLFLPLFRPRHFLRTRTRAVAFRDLKRVRLDDSAYRAGSHVFETGRGPIRCPKAYFPAPRVMADELRRLAPEVEVVFEDRKGRRRRHAPVVTKRRRDAKPKGDRSHAK